jgi:hypothetical protein
MDKVTGEEWLIIGARDGVLTRTGGAEVGLVASVLGADTATGCGVTVSTKKPVTRCFFSTLAPIFFSTSTNDIKKAASSSMIQREGLDWERTPTPTRQTAFKKNSYKGTRKKELVDYDSLHLVDMNHIERFLEELAKSAQPNFYTHGSESAS